MHYVFPYFDADDRPVYAISRTADHAADWFQEQKYAKTIKTRDYSEVDEPIYGLETIREGEPVLVTEGIADAITTHENRYPCVLPVTTQFKHDDRERLIDILEERDVLRVYVVQDAEYPTVDVNIQNELTVKQFGEGLRGAVATVAYLATMESTRESVRYYNRTPRRLTSTTTCATGTTTLRQSSRARNLPTTTQLTTRRKSRSTPPLASTT